MGIYSIQRRVIGEWPNCQEVSEIYNLDHKIFTERVQHGFKKITGRAFNPSLNNGEPEQLLKLILDYWFDEPAFFENSLIRTKKENICPSKGLLIVGRPGTSKTSLLKSFHGCVNSTKSFPFTHNSGDVKNLNFRDSICSSRKKAQTKFFTADEVVEEYENKLRGDESKFDSINRSEYTTIIDDILSERLANNFGDRLETFKKIMQDMEYRKGPYIFTCNLHGNLDGTLKMIAERYGARAYDRLFSSLNIVELKGKSMRGK